MTRLGVAVLLASMLVDGPAFAAEPMPPAPEVEVPALRVAPEPEKKPEPPRPEMSVAVETKAVIDAPKTATLGQLVRLRTDGTTGADVYSWRVLPAEAEGGLEVSEAGHKATFASGPGRYTFFLSVAGYDARRKTPTLATVVHELVIESPKPVEPEPSKAVRIAEKTDYAALLGPIVDELPDDVRADVAAAGQLFGVVAGQGITGRDEMIRETISALQNALGDNYDAMRPVIAAAIAAAKKDRRSPGTVWREIESALAGFE